MQYFDKQFTRFMDSPVNVAAAGVVILLFILAVYFHSQVIFYLKFIFKSVLRNPVRTSLTALATFVFVLLVVNVWTVVHFLNLVTEEKSQDLKSIVTERWQIPSQMPFAYESGLSTGAYRKPGDVKPDDAMTWQFFGGTIDKENRTRENIVFFFGMQPSKLLTVPRDKEGKPYRDENGRIKYTTMMDGMDELTDDQLIQLDNACRDMAKNKQHVIVGKDRLKAMKKQVGEWITVSSFNYVEIDLELKIIGQFPEGRYDQSALLNRDYIMDAMDDWKRKSGHSSPLAVNGAHPMAEKSLNLVWLKVPDTQAFQKVAAQIMDSPSFLTPAVKCETASSGVASFLDAYRDLLFGMKWIFVPSVLITMSLVIANAISISVRERRTEMAVLKVLGFRPGQIMFLVLGEAVLIGALAGFISAVAVYYLINKVMGGLKFPIAFFPAFMIPIQALWWGPAIGALTALIGSLFPSWSARTVKVSEVFSKIA
jgi:putative ABC transport system permease protein